MKNKIKGMKRAVNKDKLFYACIFIIPVINFLVLQFYVQYVDVVLFCFKRRDFDSATFQFSSEWVENFKLFYRNIFEDPRWHAAFGVTFKNFFLSWLITTPIALIVPYYIYKKFPGTTLFKFVLMLPQMIASIVWTTIVLQLTEVGFVQLFDMKMGLLANPDTQWGTLFVTGLWLGMGGTMLIFTGTYSSISDSLIEAAKVDGVGLVGEFWHIALPKIFPIWSISIITSVAGLFSSGGGSVYEYFGPSAGNHVVTIGYLLFTSSLHGGSEAITASCVTSVVFTVIFLPITLLLKKVVEHIGPTENERKPWFGGKKYGKSR